MRTKWTRSFEIGNLTAATLLLNDLLRSMNPDWRLLVNPPFSPAGYVVVPTTMFMNLLEYQVLEQVHEHSRGHDHVSGRGKGRVHEQAPVRVHRPKQIHELVIVPAHERAPATATNQGAGLDDVLF